MGLAINPNPTCRGREFPVQVVSDPDYMMVLGVNATRSGSRKEWNPGRRRTYHVPLFGLSGGSSCIGFMQLHVFTPSILKITRRSPSSDGLHRRSVLYPLHLEPKPIIFGLEICTCKNRHAIIGVGRIRGSYYVYL